MVPEGARDVAPGVLQAAAMKYVEEKEFVLRLEARCEFPDDYDGEDDGYAWVEGFQPLAAEIVRAAAAVLARHPEWRVRTSNRGRPADEEVTLVIDRIVANESEMK